MTQALRLIVRELRRLREAAPSAAELRRARDYVIGQIDLSLESTDNQMNWLGEQLLGYGRILPPCPDQAAAAAGHCWGNPRRRA